MRRFARFSLAALLAVGCTDSLAPVARLAPGLPSASNGSSDATPPDLTGLSFSTPEINTTQSADNVTIDFTVTDDISGAVELCLVFESPTGFIRFGSICTQFPATTAGGSSMVVTFPRFSEAGIWTINQISLRDAVGNNRILRTTDIAGLGLPTTIVVRNTIEVTIQVLPVVFPRIRFPIPVTILRTSTFDPAIVVVSSLRFGANGTEVAPLGWKLFDVDRDGDLDLVLAFPLVGSGIVCGASSVKLTGQTSAGDFIEGSDAIRTAGCR